MGGKTVKRILVPLLFTFLFVHTGTGATVYKCTAPDGTARFSDQPCGESAEVAFADDKIPGVDEAIGNACPYEGLVTFSPDIDADIALHARTIGRSILPEKRLASHEVAPEHQGTHYSWKAILSYRSIEKAHDWARIEMTDEGLPVEGGIRVLLTFIRIKRFDWATPLPTLKNVQSLEKNAHYGWRVVPSRQPQ